MALQTPHLGQEKQNRKLLEQLEEQKKRLKMAQSGGGVAGGGGGPVSVNTANLTSVPPTPTPTPASMLASLPQGGPAIPATPMMNVHPGGDQGHMTPQQRAALQHAHANSVGYFITQDSSFGNLILPVLPRFDPPKS